jgi:hypothetical protein
MPPVVSAKTKWLIRAFEDARTSLSRAVFHAAHEALAEALRVDGAVALDGWRYSVDAAGDVWRTPAPWSSKEPPRSRVDRVRNYSLEAQRRKAARASLPDRGDGPP